MNSLVIENEVDVRSAKSSVSGILIKHASMPDVLNHSESISQFIPTQGRSRRSTMLTYSNVKVSYWAREPVAKNYVLRLFTCFYAMFLIIVGVVLELSNLIAHGTEHVVSYKDVIFAAYMYGCSVAVIGLCAKNVIAEQMNVKKTRRNLAKQVVFYEEPEILTNPSTGSLYLRLGCLAFGFAGVVYYVLIIIMNSIGWNGVEATKFSSGDAIISLMATIFMFSQMWFVYCNGKIAISGKSRSVVSFGLMHLVATNVWVWISSVMHEEAHTISEIQLTNFKHSDSDLLQDFPSIELSMIQNNSTISDAHASVADIRSHLSSMGMQCLVGHQLAEFMHTCVVEYSIICAGIAFVFWANCGVRNDGYVPKARKRNILRIDCSRTAVGIFAGIIVLLFTLLAVLLQTSSTNDPYTAHVILISADICIFGVAISVCCFAFWKMRVLAFNALQAREDASAQFLDGILLVIGLIGEWVFCIGGMLAFLNHSNIHILAVLLFVSNIIRVIQVTLQSALIMIADRLVLDTDNPKTIRHKPGKQVVTMLLIANVAMFFINIFEAQTAGVSEAVVQMYGGRSWALIVRACSPLTVFYRFHSSVCLAEIWKNTFKVQRARARSI